MKKFLTFIFFALCSVCIYAYEFAISSIKTNENKVSVYRGKSMQTVQDDNFLISMLATKCENGIQFSASITNFCRENYFFDENCVSVYQGVYEDDIWKKIEYMPASKYYMNEYNTIKTQAIATGIMMGISASNAGYSSVNGSGYVGGTRYTYKANVYSSADASIAMTNSYMVLDNMQHRNQNYLQYLENNLLYSSEIEASGNYNGFFVVDKKKGPDYKVVFEMSPTEQFVFYFTRSDKDEILNPWKDKSHSRHCIVGGISPLFYDGSVHGSLYYMFCRARLFGFYGGFTYRYGTNGIDSFASVKNVSSKPEIEGVRWLDSDKWDFDYDESDMKYDSFGVYSGLTFKAFDNTWLLLGTGFDSIVNLYYKGDLSYNGYFKESYGDCYLKEEYATGGFFTPQIGLNYITNHFDFGIMSYFPIGFEGAEKVGKFNVDILFGFAL